MNPDKRAGLGRSLLDMVGMNLNQIRALNRRVVLQCIRDAGTIARVEIADRLDVSPATVSVVTSELLADRLIEPVERMTETKSGRGRPKTLLRLRSEAAYAIGIKLALHQAAVSITNFVGDVLASETVPIAPEDRTPGRVIKLCEEQIRNMREQTSMDASGLLGVGIGVSGCVAYEEGRVIWSPMFADRDVPLKSAIEERTGLNVVVDNEANLVGLAEKWFGLGREYPSYVLVTVEHGVGMSIVINHQIYRGARGFSGEFGHTKFQTDGTQCRCGQFGCVEAYVADYAVVREAERLVGKVPIHDQRAVQDALDGLATEANSGNADASAIFARAGRILGISLANVVNLFDPPVIIVSGQRTMHPANVFFESIESALDENVLIRRGDNPRVMVHPWGDDLWARGAAALVLEEFLPSNSFAKKRTGTQDDRQD